MLSVPFFGSRPKGRVLARGPLCVGRLVGFDSHFRIAPRRGKENSRPEWILTFEGRLGASENPGLKVRLSGCC